MAGFKLAGIKRHFTEFPREIVYLCLSTTITCFGARARGCRQVDMGDTLTISFHVRDYYYFHYLRALIARRARCRAIISTLIFR